MERPEFKMCKPHPEEKAEFYISNEPWNKFCKTCALNRAICGYKIEKDLTPQQFENKIILSSLVQQLKSTIENCEKQSTSYSNFIEKINTQLLSYISPMIKNIDNFIKELVDVKNQILELYDIQVHQKLNKCHEIQNKYFMDSMHFKRELENLETNYCDIIVDSKDGSEQVKQVSLIKAQIEKSRKFSEEKISVEQYLSNSKAQFEAKFREFEQKIAEINGSFTNFTKSPQPLTDREQNIRLTIDNTMFEDPRMSLKGNLDDKIYYSHRKKSNLTSSICGQQNKYPSQLTSRPTNLTLKPTIVKRNNSIPLKSKVFKLLEG